jgi:hypothetical protein
MKGSLSPADQALLVGMDSEVGIVATRVFTGKINRDTLVALHTETPIHRQSFRLPNEVALAQRLRDTLVEQFGKEQSIPPDGLETFVTYLIDCPPKEWPAKLKELTDLPTSAV